MGKTIEIYWNSRKKCWSVRDPKTLRVVGHKTRVTLVDAEFRVSKPGRQRVLVERRKNVHAVVRGEDAVVRGEDAVVRGEDANDKGGLTARVRYNPYEMDKFQVDGRPIERADRVDFFPDGTVYVS